VVQTVDISILPQVVQRLRVRAMLVVLLTLLPHSMLLVAGEDLEVLAELEMLPILQLEGRVGPEPHHQ
jgi:hypothetical protein